MFSFADYVMILKKSWKGGISDPDLITLLYGMIAQPANLLDKEGEIISCSKTTASEIMHHRANPHHKIKEHSRDAVVLQGINQAFAEQVMKHLLTSMMDRLREELTECITSSDLPKATKSRLLGLASREPLTEFLAEAYLQALAEENRIISVQERHIKDNLKNMTPPQLVVDVVPKVPMNEELPYINALLHAYSDAENGIDITLEQIDSFPKYHKHLTRQRTDYFSAEAVRRGTRDFYGEDEVNQFDVLKDEIYDGIIDVYEDDWSNGLERVKNVLMQASRVSVARCWLSKRTDWIGNSQKKGICHILVNDGRIQGWKEEDV